MNMGTKMSFAELYVACFLLLIVLILGIVLIFTQTSLFELVKNESIPLNDEVVPEDEEDSNTNIQTIKAIYLTSWSASKNSFIDYLIDIARTTEINAVVIDIKDFSGYVGYDTDVRDVEKYGAEQKRISDIDSLVERLHAEDIYVIARITVFQDPILARARPDLAIHSEAEKDSLWLDNSGLAWIDPAAKESWDYNIAIARDVVSHGFDEVNFDYVRFPSDGDLKDMSFPFWDEKVPKRLIIRQFFKHLREELSDVKISIDLFGLSTVSSDDLGVGQVIEHAFEYSDYVCPMIYPSHYSDGFIGFQNPAEYPYEVVKYSLEGALKKLMVYKQSKETNVQLRPWLQDFDLGADYDAEMVRAQIKAVYDALGHDFNGFMIWSSSNYYTREAFEPKENSKINRVCINNDCFYVELAETQEQRSRGLMHRETLDQDKGMFFIFNEEREHSFWMKNTLIPLDIIWINEDKEIVDIKKDVQPCVQEGCEIFKPSNKAKYVLELNAGQSKKTNIKTGDRLIFK